uniref:Mcl1_mid domain-containing protein n=1 Tax=Echinostoma caproni TaxID=27848 RepID=A0A183AKZ5_9TREM
LSGMPTCVTSGGPANLWFAVGSDLGSVFLFDRTQLMENEPADPCDSMKDVSVGLSTGVCALALSNVRVDPTGTVPSTRDEPCDSSSAELTYNSALLATICEQPSWNAVHLWSVVSCSHPVPDSPASKNDDCINDPAELVHEEVPSTPRRRRHKRGKLQKHKPVSSPVKKTDTHFFPPEPVCHDEDNERIVGITQPYAIASVSHFSMGSKASSSLRAVKQVSDMTLPQGDLPACLAVHPSRSRALIGVGTMNGGVEVYFLSPITHTLSRVYSLNNAHPIFVTALTFLPVRPSATEPPITKASTETMSAKPCQLPAVQSEPSYELVSVSVDRQLRWHPGPSSIQISRLAHGLAADPVGVWTQGKRFLRMLMLYFGLVFLFPISLALFDRVFYGLF